MAPTWSAGDWGLGRREAATSGRPRPGRADPTSERALAATPSSWLRRRSDWECRCNEVSRRHRTIVTNLVTVVLSVSLLNSRLDCGSAAAATPPSMDAYHSAQNRGAALTPECVSGALEPPLMLDTARPLADHGKPDPLRRDRREVVSPARLRHQTKYYRERRACCRRGSDSRIHPTFATAPVMNESTAEESSWGR